MVHFVEILPTIKEYNKLTEAVGWGKFDEKLAETALVNSAFGICAFDGEEIIGMARMVGDKAMFLYIQDVMVMPEYQGKGIGSELMYLMMERIEKFKEEVNPDIRVYLGAVKGKEEFYEKFGFIKREEAGLGEAMIYQGNSEENME